MPALFLDRDGVINVDHGYVHSKNNFDFLPNIFELVKSANDFGYLVIIITNQAGIGRGFYSVKEFEELSIWMCSQFKSHGAYIDAIYYSPFHPNKGLGRYLKSENTRKPGTGMFEEAERDFDIIMESSIMVGDKMTDMAASIRSKVGKNYLLNCSNQVNPIYFPHDIEVVTDLTSIISEISK